MQSRTPKTQKIRRRRLKAGIGPCPAHFSNPKLRYCYNRGKCYAVYFGRNDFSAFCKCARNFTGPRCEYLFDSEVYGFARMSDEHGEMEHKALTTVAVILVLLMGGFVWCLLLHRKLIKRTERQHTNNLTSISSSTNNNSYNCTHNTSSINKTANTAEMTHH